MSFSFACDLQSIVVDIESGLLNTSPKHAFDLMSKFLTTANKVFERADDSSGDIGGVYRESVLLWLSAANAWKNSTAAGAKINWLERVYTLYLENDYSVYDTLLPNSAILLSHEQLTQLAWRYESELRQTLKTTGKTAQFNLDALNCSVALSAVAEALKDPVLYERATLIHSPEPNDLQKESMIKVFLKFNQTDGALHWLKTPWLSHFESDRLRLLDEVYLQNANVDALKQTRYQTYLHDKTYSSLMRYSECLSESEKQSARFEAIQLAEKNCDQSDCLAINIEMLLRLNETERVQFLVLKNPLEIADIFYDNVLKLAKQFEEQKYWLAATVCYRNLLLNILNQARTKAYTHAARYYKKLVSISKHIQQYKPLDDHADFIKQLNETHGRKRSFWDRVL